MIELCHKDYDEVTIIIKCSRIVDICRDYYDQAICVSYIEPLLENSHNFWIGGRFGGYIMHKGKEYTGDYIYKNYESFKKLLAVINHNSEIEDAMEKL